METAIGAQLGPYRIEASLGQGGMGAVYLAVDTRLERQVAIKIPAERFNSRFEREARAVAALNHPNICTLYDVGPDYLVMELVEGPTLADRIRQGPVPVEEAMGIAKQIADALDAAHERGIVHRDLKPANIKIKPDGVVKVLDFGLARVIHPAELPRLDDPTRTMSVTEAGTLLGTPSYMAPEQAVGQTVDKRADIWSLGVILYEMITGTRLFAGDSTAEILRAVMTREPDWDRVPEGARPLLRRCLERDRKRRLRDIGDAQFVLEERPAERNRPSRRLWIAAAAGPVAGALAGWAVSRFRQPPVDRRVLRLHIEPPAGSQFTFGVGTFGISLSPDGRTAAYVATDHGKAALWVRPLDDRTARRLEGTEGAGMPFWSPDSRSIGFFVRNQLHRIDPAGGAPQLITEGIAGQSGRGAAWSPDGRILFGMGNFGLYQVPASGGQPTVLTTRDAALEEVIHAWPQILPGGRFLYFVKSRKPEKSGVFASPLGRPAERVRLLTSETNALYAPGWDAAGGKGTGYLLWVRGRTLVAQAFDPDSSQLSGEPRTIADPVSKMGVTGKINAEVSANGLLLYSPSNPLRQFTWIDRTGKPQGLVGEPGLYGFFRLSADGRRVVASHEGPEGSNLWILDAERGVATRFTNRPGTTVDPVWSPDGRTIMFGFGPPWHIFRKSTGGDAEEALVSLPNGQVPLDWSRDGRFVLYEDSPADAGQLSMWVLPMAPTDGSPRPYRRSTFNETMGRFSPDTHWVAYSSDESGQFEVYIDAFPEPRDKVRISTGGGIMPVWGAGGRELFYITPDFKLVSVTLELGAGLVKPGAPHELFKLPVVDWALRPYDVAPDGRFLVRDFPERLASPLTVIVNWPALLA